MADNFNISDVPSGGGASDFLALTDTPGRYAGAGSEFVKVNPGATALEFLAGAAGGLGFSLTETVLTSGDVSITAVAFTDVVGAVTPSFTPGAGEVVVVYAVMGVNAPGGADKLRFDILHDNSGAFVSVFGTTLGFIEVERDDHSTCFAFPINMPAAVLTSFKLQAEVDAGTGVLKADAAGLPFVFGVLRT